MNYFAFKKFPSLLNNWEKNLNWWYIVTAKNNPHIYNENFGNIKIVFIIYKIYYIQIIYNQNLIYIYI